LAIIFSNFKNLINIGWHYWRINNWFGDIPNTSSFATHWTAKYKIKFIVLKIKKNLKKTERQVQNIFLEQTHRKLDIRFLTFAK